MTDGNKMPTFLSKLNENLDEYSKKNLLDHQVDIYSTARLEPESAVFDCRFKDSCHALRYKQGGCPCELYE
jgi:hypothetical protein